MNFPSAKMIKQIRAEYPVGTKIRLIYMDDPQAPPTGTVGTITSIDDIGQIHWTGSGLALIYGQDRFEKI